MSEQRTPDELTLQRELQEARRLWLDAETRAMDAEQRLVKWQKLHFDLQQKLVSMAVQQACDALAAPWVALAAEIRSKS
jgi:hypothetical protein